MPDKMFKCLEDAAKADGKSVKDWIADASMLKACGKTKMQFLEEARKV